jgi:hypothetical protein
MLKLPSLVVKSEGSCPSPVARVKGKIDATPRSTQVWYPQALANDSQLRARTRF